MRRLQGREKRRGGGGDSNGEGRGAGESVRRGAAGEALTLCALLRDSRADTEPLPVSDEVSLGAALPLALSASEVLSVILLLGGRLASEALGENMSPAIRVALRDAFPVGARVLVAPAEALPVSLLASDALPDTVMVELPLPAPEVVPEPDSNAVMLASLAVADTVMAALPLPIVTPACVPVRVGVTLRVMERVAVGDRVALRVGVKVRVPVAEGV